MKTFVKVPFQKVIEVRSVVTAHVYDMRGKLVEGEVHDFPEIFYVVEGNAHPVTDRGEYYLNEGQLIIYGPNVYHGEPVPTQRGNCVAGIMAFVSESPALNALYDKPITLTAAQKQSYRKLLEEGSRILENVEDPEHRGMRPREDAAPSALQNVQNHLELFLLDLLQNPDPQSNREHFLDLRLDEIYQYFSANVHRQLGAEQAARELNMSVFFLRSLIKKKKNCGVTDYFNALKLDKAKELLQNTPMNVTEISLALGFSSVHYFSRLFKKKTGLSPMQYAQRQRESR